MSLMFNGLFEIQNPFNFLQENPITDLRDRNFHAVENAGLIQATNVAGWYVLSVATDIVTRLLKLRGQETLHQLIS